MKNRTCFVLILGLILSLAACEGATGLDLVAAQGATEATTATCDTWGTIALEGLFLGRSICQNNVPVHCWDNSNADCSACPVAATNGYQSCVDGVWYCICTIGD